MARLSTDHGDTADRIATIEPVELHRAIATASIAALRTGAPIERLDGLEYFHLHSAGFGTRNVVQQRRELLTAQIDRQRLVASQAREHANTATSSRVREAFLQDVEDAYADLGQLERQLEQLDAADNPTVLPEQFEAEADFIAHALGQLAEVRTTRSAEFGEALRQVITDVRISPDPNTRTCAVEFSLLLPADGMVLRFGPIRTTVANRAYAARLPDDQRPDAARLLLTQQATTAQLRTPQAASDNEILQHVKRALVERGYSDLAAGTIVRSDFRPLYAIAAHDLWGEPLPEEYDPRFVEHVMALYRDPQFRWNPRHHTLDCSMRQKLVDVLADNGGSANLVDVINRLRSTKIDDQRVATFSKRQQFGEAPSWEPCVERIGDWRQKAPRSGRSLRVWACPHCGGKATKVIRVPEVPSCVLCPDCRRMPTESSPVFPAAYLEL